ncbi:transcriptional regulator with XRE-family HTH domain [Actinokineospora baliensis]|uniref:XRE family transcriptional regulator n=1 Tax=Actinokineospora baliensis TaxID=547056 RepID=UPI00195B2576|nr:XRE family transcriptional regulator [Actinokineospora baliensis]MBM7773538.1 transcriptional regulator with XRE-family HTH domain [Actinokineospora baliensis]
MDPAPHCFADALRAAIADSEITLERVAEQLRARGTPVSLATLSYWQTGRSRPERPRSIAALGHLEDLLGLGAGALRGLLEAPRPRGRSARRTPRPLAASAPWADTAEFRRLVAELDLSHDTAITRLSAHDRIVIGPDRAKTVQRTRQVLRAERDGVDRLVVTGWAEREGGAPPTLTGTRNCTLGRVNVDLRGGQVAAELLFDRPLGRRETIIVEHEYHLPSPRPIAYGHQRVSRMPVREYLLEVRFDPRALPRYCVQFTDVGGREQVRALTLDSAYTVHTMALDLEPGRHGIRWAWGTPEV